MVILLVDTFFIIVLKSHNLLLDTFMYSVLFEILCKRSGVNQWRDQLKPSQMLQNLARMRGIPAPHIADDGSFVSFGGREYRLDELGMLIQTIRPFLGLNISFLVFHQFFHYSGLSIVDVFVFSVGLTNYKFYFHF